ncbi:MAG: helix-turn-helix domain-containing protein [Candidatus Nealsonbacteria bacterium]|nr:helix-turn-helix domain-containing protein [Candidatus Nealsonbacteria bacterium]
MTRSRSKPLGSGHDFSEYYNLLWEGVQVARELTRSVERLADHFAPSACQSPSADPALVKKLDAVLSKLAADSRQEGGRRYYYTIPELAKERGWSSQHLREACREGWICADKKNGKWRIAPEEVERIAGEGVKTAGHESSQLEKQ